MAVTHLRAEAFGRGFLGATVGEAFRLDPMPHEEGDDYDKDEVGRVGADVALVVGQQQVGEPQERGPQTRGGRAGQAIAQGRVRDRHYQKSYRDAGGEDASRAWDAQVDEQVGGRDDHDHDLDSPKGGLSKRGFEGTSQGRHDVGAAKPFTHRCQAPGG